jgi:uridine kinase
LNKEIDSQVQQVADRVLELVDLGRLMPVVLIDGRAASGKSTFAENLQNQLFKQGESMPRLIHMDDLYEGWGGLAAGSEYLARNILSPLAKGETASWQEYDWVKEKRINWREFSGGTPLIIEGCGAVSRRSKEFADLTIWIQAEESVRRNRWIEREGNDNFFDKWAASELEYYAKEKSSGLCELVVNLAT